MSSSLSLRHVHKRYPKAPSEAVSDLSLTIATGEIVGLVGASGSGKTSVLRMIAGLETPSSGEIVLGDSVVAGPKESIPPEDRGVGLVFQEGALFPHMNVRKNVAYGLQGQPSSKRHEEANRMLELVGLSDKGQRYPHELSGGERQRVALARALAPHPKVILLDEPFSNLDPGLREDLRGELLAVIQRVGATALIVTHDVMDALIIADRIAVLKDGRLIQCASSDEVYHSPADLYCARLFGPAFPLPSAWERLSSTQDRTWLRPQDLAWSVEHAEGSLPATVKSTQFLGDYLGLVVQLDGHSGDDLVVPIPLAERVRPTEGESGWVRLRGQLRA